MGNMFKIYRTRIRIKNVISNLGSVGRNERFKIMVGKLGEEKMMKI